jgi:hypothetical protein
MKIPCIMHHQTQNMKANIPDINANNIGTRTYLQCLPHKQMLLPFVHTRCYSVMCGVEIITQHGTS